MHVILDLKSVVHHRVEVADLHSFSLHPHFTFLHHVKIMQEFKLFHLEILEELLSLVYQCSWFDLLNRLFVKKSNLEKGEDDYRCGGVVSEDRIEWEWAEIASQEDAEKTVEVRRKVEGEQSQELWRVFEEESQEGSKREGCCSMVKLLESIYEWWVVAESELRLLCREEVWREVRELILLLSSFICCLFLQEGFSGYNLSMRNNLFKLMRSHFTWILIFFETQLKKLFKWIQIILLHLLLNCVWLPTKSTLIASIWVSYILVFSLLFCCRTSANLIRRNLCRLFKRLYICLTL